MYVTIHVPHHVHSRILEEFEYSSVCSVNEEEPPTTHSLIFNLPHHVSPTITVPSWISGSLCPTQSVYACHLLRKALLLKVFQRLGVYKPDVRLPAEVSCTTVPSEQSVTVSSPHP